MTIRHGGLGDSRAAATATFLFGLCSIAFPAAAIEISDVRLVSVASDGTPANKRSEDPSISGDGRYVAFASDADNLVPDDINTVKDVFVHDTVAGETRRVNVATDGSEANGASTAQAISGNGNYVVFGSAATNLVAGDGNGLDDIFVHDLVLAETTRINVASDGTESLGPVLWPADISDDGRLVVFSSSAPNLVANDTNGVGDIFVHDRDTRETRRVSINNTGGDQISQDALSPKISGDGRFVTFESAAVELVPGDTNDRNDVFLVDLTTGAMERISDAPNGMQQNGQGAGAFATVSNNADWIAFISDATNLVPNDSTAYDVFLFHRPADQLVRISENADGVGANAPISDGVVVSGNGRLVLYAAEASNIVPPTNPGDSAISQAFLHDTDTGQTIRVSGDTGTGQANAHGKDMSDDGLTVVLASATRNLLATAPTSQNNIFLIRISDSTAPDTTPDAFSFTDQTGVATNAVATSNAVTITGIEAPAQISVTNGEYSIGCGSTFTSSDGTISDGQTVCVRHTSSAVSNTAQVTSLTVGGVSATFTSTTTGAQPPPPPPNQGGGGGGALGFMSLLPLVLLLRRRWGLPRA